MTRNKKGSSRLLRSIEPYDSDNENLDLYATQSNLSFKGARDEVRMMSQPCASNTELLALAAELMHGPSEKHSENIARVLGRFGPLVRRHYGNLGRKLTIVSLETARYERRESALALEIAAESCRLRTVHALDSSCFVLVWKTE